MSLSDQEAAFLEQLLWFTANIAADSERSQVDAVSYQIDKFIGIVMHNYSSQLKASVWRVLVWCLSVISQSLEFIKNPLYDVYNCVICLHF